VDGVPVTKTNKMHCPSGDTCKADQHKRLLERDKMPLGLLVYLESLSPRGSDWSAGKEKEEKMPRNGILELCVTSFHY